MLHAKNTLEVVVGVTARMLLDSKLIAFRANTRPLFGVWRESATVVIRRYLHSG